MKNRIKAIGNMTVADIRRMGNEEKARIDKSTPAENEARMRELEAELEKAARSTDS